MEAIVVFKSVAGFFTGWAMWGLILFGILVLSALAPLIANAWATSTVHGSAKPAPNPLKELKKAPALNKPKAPEPVKDPYDRNDAAGVQIAKTLIGKYGLDKDLAEGAALTRNSLGKSPSDYRQSKAEWAAYATLACALQLASGGSEPDFGALAASVGEPESCNTLKFMLQNPETSQALDNLTEAHTLLVLATANTRNATEADKVAADYLAQAYHDRHRNSAIPTVQTVDTVQKRYKGGARPGDIAKEHVNLE